MIAWHHKNSINPSSPCMLLALLSLGFVWATTTKAIGGTDAHLDSVLHAWQTRQERVRSFRFNWSQRQVWHKDAFLNPPKTGSDSKNPQRLIVPTETTAFDASHSLVCEGSKIRVAHERMELGSDKVLRRQNTVSVADGSTCKVFYTPGAVGYPLGGTGGEAVNPLDTDDPSLKPLFMVYRSLYPEFGSFNTEKFRKTVSIAQSDAVVGDHSCVLLKVSNRPASRSVRLLWVDRERDFIPLRQNLLVDGAVLTQLDWQDYQKSGTEWVPTRWKAIYMNKDGTVSMSATSTVSEFSLNAAIEESEFQLNFPPGTLVRDRRSGGLEYILREGGEKRIITPEDSGANYEQLLNSESGKALDSTSLWRTNSTMLVMLIIALILVGFSVMFMILRRRGWKLLPRNGLRL